MPVINASFLDAIINFKYLCVYCSIFFRFCCDFMRIRKNIFKG
nr:hypothetical protein [uncultured bacterium]